MEVKHRKKRSDTGTRLTERDLLALRLIGEQYALRFDQLQTLLGHHAKAHTKHAGMLSASATKHALDRWQHAGLVQSKKLLADLPAFCWLTREGLYAASLPFHSLEPSPTQLHHIGWVAQARLHFASQHPEWSWTSERWLRVQLDQKGKSLKLPDALLHLPDDRRIALEVELTHKNATTLEQIIKDRVLVYDHTWYFATTRAQTALHTAIDQLDDHDQQRVTIYPLDILTRT